MKRFTVACHSTVEDQLAKLIVENWGTSLAEQITAAANRIDSELRLRADEAGTPVKPDLRTLVVYPLAVEYQVSLDDRLAVILDYQLAVDTAD